MFLVDIAELCVCVNVTCWWFVTCFNCDLPQNGVFTIPNDDILGKQQVRNGTQPMMIWWLV